MAIQVVIINGREYVKLATRYITKIIDGKKIRIDARERERQCFFLLIPKDKFDPNRYSG